MPEFDFLFHYTNLKKGRKAGMNTGSTICNGHTAILFPLFTLLQIITKLNVLAKIKKNARCKPSHRQWLDDSLNKDKLCFFYE